MTGIRTRSISIAAGAACVVACALLGGASASVAPAGTTQLISRATGLGSVPPGNHNYSFSEQESVSSDGRFVTFDSQADGLSTEDDNRRRNIFLRDRLLNTTILVSRASGVSGAGANGQSYSPVISADGTRVAFESFASNLDPAATLGEHMIYIRNLSLNTTKLVSRATGAAGVPANNDSLEASISGDGSKVAFFSRATNLETLGTATANQVYVRDVDADTLELVSRADTSAGPIGNGASFDASISGDGKTVAFASNASNLNAADLDTTSDVFLRDLLADTTSLISRASTATGAKGNQGSFRPALSVTGKQIAFDSAATNLDAADIGTGIDVYLRDLSALTTALVSRETGATGAVGDGASANPAISGDGTRIVFESAATNFAAGAAPTPYDNHIFMRDTAGNTTTLADRADGASGAIADLGGFRPSISQDGAFVAFSSNSTNLTSPPGDSDFSMLVVRDLTAMTTSSAFLPSDGLTAWSWIDRRGVSGDGRFVAFKSDSDSLSSEDDNRWWNAYRRDTLTNTTAVVSRASGAAGAAANNWTDDVSISSDGSRIAFSTRATNLVVGDTNGVTDCFVRDLNADTTTLVSRTSAGALLTAESRDCMISFDGTRVAFRTANGIDPADTDGNNDIYVRDLSTGQTIFASRADGVSGSGADGGAIRPSINRDGTKVAFLSNGDLTGAGPVGDQLYVRDLGAGTTKLASRADGAAGAAGAGYSDAVDMDGAGNRVVFYSSAANLVAGDVNSTYDVFLRDLSANTTTLLSRADGPSGALGSDFSYSPAISENGNLVTFSSVAPNLAAGDANGTYDVFVRDLAANTTTAVSRNTAGALGDRQSLGSAISGNGHCVAFRSYAENLDPATGPSDFSFVYLRTVSGECPNESPDTTLSGAPAAKTKSRTATLAIASNDATASFQCALDGGAFAACGASKALAGLADGTHTFSARAVDPAGNVDATPASVTWNVDATGPVITIVVPKQKLKKLLASGLTLRLRASEIATARARLTRSGKLVGSASKAVGPTAKTLTIRLKLSKKARRALKRARSVRLVLVIVGTDALGNARTVRRTIVIRR